MKPNLFAYATKELSQDAMICWLIAWSATAEGSEAHKALPEIGRRFVEALLGKHDVKLTGAVRRAEIHQQEHGIDVLARIHDENSTHVLLIEDKTHTSAHGDQLRRYRDVVAAGETSLGNVREHWPVYLKTGILSLAEQVNIEENGYKVFHREDLLGVLDAYHGTHPIVIDFRKHVRGLEDDFNSFGDWRQGDKRGTWTWAGWEGLFQRLERELEAEDKHAMGWGYVPNQAGGFLGFWLFPSDTGQQSGFYIQLEAAPGNPERQKLCFKVAPGNEDAEKYAEDFYGTLLEVSGAGLMERPRRFGRRGSGTMTVGWWRGDWLAFGSDGKLDIKRTADNLRQAAKVAEKGRRKWQSQAR